LGAPKWPIREKRRKQGIKISSPIFPISASCFTVSLLHLNYLIFPTITLCLITDTAFHFARHNLGNVLNTEPLLETYARQWKSKFRKQRNTRAHEYSKEVDGTTKTKKPRKKKSVLSESNKENSQVATIAVNSNEEEEEDDDDDQFGETNANEVYGFN
jgi:hypothetical protein